MNRALVGEPSVSAFLRSVRRNLSAQISGLELFLLSNTSPNYYDPRQDLKKLKEKLTSVQDLLIDGEARRLGEESVDEWMDDIKDLLYDVEDILDDVKSLTNHQVSNIHELYKTSDELKNRLGDNLAWTEELGDRAKDLELKRGTEYAFSGKSKVTLRTPETSSVVDISEIHGREDDKTKILMRLLEVDARQKKNYVVLCIVGMGGLGKTTLAQLVFNDPDVVKHFDVKSWVCISNVFDVVRATKELIENLGGGGGEQQTLAGLQMRLKEIVANKKFLFVLDDVWSSSEWEKMKGPFSSCASGSKILVTTRNNNIAHALGNKEPYHLQGLDHKQCMEIFRDKAFVYDEEEHEKLIFGEKIVAACGGAPLVVKVIGSMLQLADAEMWGVVSENTASWANNNDEIHPAIRFSYYDMPASLKRCFEYLAVFPPDYKFEQDDVVCLWIADGLVEEVEGRRVEDIGNEYFNELKARSLIQENNMMHDIVHHLASIVSKANSKVPRACVRHVFLSNLNAMNYEFLAQAPCLRTLIVENGYGDALLYGLKLSKMLRTLKLGGYCEIYMMENCIHNLKHLRYLNLKSSDVGRFQDYLCMLDNLQFLNLEQNRYTYLPNGMIHLSNLRCLRFGGNSISSLPESMMGSLSQLQVLVLNDNLDLKQLPEDIGNLRSLRTLDLSFTSISSLPESICNLNQLQVLDLGDCKDLTRLPKDIGKLRSLRRLRLRETYISNLPESICALSQLQVLDLKNCECFRELPKDIGNLRSLRKLNLERTYISCLPETICALSQLQTLKLDECQRLEELPKDIGNLRSLRKLHLRVIYNLSLPESILNLTGLDDLLVDEDITLHIESTARLKEWPIYHEGKEEERRGMAKFTKLNVMNLVICMENIEGIEEAKMADLKSKNFRVLEFRWSQISNDEEMAVKIMEALEPHHALESLTFSNYGGDKFPAWMMSSNICLSNLVKLKMEGLSKICEMVDMEFVSLESLWIENFHMLRKVLMATPKLVDLQLLKCGELAADSVHLLPSLSDKAGLHSIVLRLKNLHCDYNIFEYFLEKLKTANSKWDNLEDLRLSVGGRRVASLPMSWPNMMNSLDQIVISDIGPGKFQFLADDDQSAFPPYLDNIYINSCEIEERLPHHWYTITADGEVKAENESIDKEEVEE